MVFFAKTYPLKREMKGTYTNGEWVPGINDPLTQVIANIQPVTGKELEALEIGKRNLGKIKIYTDTELIVSEDGDNQNGDLITWQNEKYEIIAEEVRDNTILNHKKYFAELRKNSDRIDEENILDVC